MCQCSGEAIVASDSFNTWAGEKCRIIPDIGFCMSMSVPTWSSDGEEDVAGASADSADSCPLYPCNLALCTSIYKGHAVHSGIVGQTDSTCTICIKTLLLNCSRSHTQVSLVISFKAASIWPRF